jgi:hypothetical protein
MKQLILDKLNAILEDAQIEEQKGAYRELNQEFYAIYSEEQKNLQERQLDLEQEVIPDPENEALNKAILDALAAIKTKLAEAKLLREKEELDNLKKKKNILTVFTDLLQNEENIGVLFNRIKEIREEWKNIGSIPRDHYEEMQRAFSGLNDTFNYNVNIYKELKDHDLKRNYSLKNQLVHELQELLKETNIRTIEKAVKRIQNEWEEIGPTPNQYWEELKTQYWDNIKAVYEKIRSHYEQLKAEQQQNLLRKKELIEKAAETISELPTNFKQWEATTNRLNALMDEWKKVGFAPKDENDLVWKEFRNHFNTFFDEKSAFFKAQNEVFAVAKQAKQELINKLDELINPADWKTSTQKIIQAQNDWKKIGSAGRSEDKLWKAFRAKCDEFFNQKDAFFKEKESEQYENLAKKKELIATIQAYVPGEDHKDTINQLKEFSKAFNEIGNVPLKEKDEIYNNYKNVLNAHYDNLKMNQSEKERLLFEAKLEQLQQSSQPAKFILQEKDKIRNRINEITKEIANYENNLGFFSKGKTAEALLSNVKQTIEKGKSEIESLKAKLKLINAVDKKE